MTSGMSTATLMAMKTLGSKIEAYLAESGWSDRELARRVGVSPTTVSNWIEGKRDPRRKELLALSRVIRQPVEYLAYDDVDDPALPLSEGDRLVLATMHRLGLEADEAIVALASYRRPPDDSGKADDSSFAAGTKSLSPLKPASGQPRRTGRTEPSSRGRDRSH
jgi:transcriptional regulator with XRE-family HTH domain